DAYTPDPGDLSHPEPVDLVQPSQIVIMTFHTYFIPI
ncbi:hypothetical protein F444_12225, partial [Phytophthora nicotianae P1976]